MSFDVCIGRCRLPKGLATVDRSVKPGGSIGLRRLILQRTSCDRNKTAPACEPEAKESAIGRNIMMELTSFSRSHRHGLAHRGDERAQWSVECLA
jgi:hypothetical protein